MMLEKLVSGCVRQGVYCAAQVVQASHVRCVHDYKKDCTHREP
jgi:hypothetical protein